MVKPNNVVRGIGVCCLVFSIIALIYSNNHNKSIIKEYNHNVELFETVISDLEKQVKDCKDKVIKDIIVKEKRKQHLMDSLTYLNPHVDPIIKEQIINALIIECDKVNLPPLLSLCIIKQESNFNPLVKNGMSATGLMQVIPKYHQDKIDKHGWEPHEVFFINNNILLGTEILKEYFDESNNMVKALQKYVGAISKSNANKYIENIINDYVSLQVMYFMNNKPVQKIEGE